MSAPLHPYDQDTIDYLKAVGVGDPLLDRVRRLAQEVADLKAARTAEALKIGRES